MPVKVYVIWSELVVQDAKKHENQGGR